MFRHSNYDFISLVLSPTETVDFFCKMTLKCQISKRYLLLYNIYLFLLDNNLRGAATHSHIFCYLFTFSVCLIYFLFGKDLIQSSREKKEIESSRRYTVFKFYSVLLDNITVYWC